MDVVHITESDIIKLESQASKKMEIRTCNTLDKSYSCRICHIYTYFRTVEIDKQSTHALLPALLMIFVYLAHPNIVCGCAT